MAGIPNPALPLADVCFSYFLGFSALKGNGLPVFILSLLLHGWAPAGFLRGFCRLAVSIGIVMEKGKAYQPGESLCQESIFILLVYGQRGQGRGDPGALGRLSDQKCSCKTIIQWGEPSPFQYIIPFSHYTLYRLC